jgi:hypothetical protein
MWVGGGEMRRRLLAVLVLVFVFAVGFGLGQSGKPASAQVPSTEEKAALIRAEIKGTLIYHNSRFRGDMADAINNLDLGSGNDYLRWALGRYLDTLAPLARDNANLGRYLQYMGPALQVYPNAPKTLLEDRFVDHFSNEMAKTGLPPAFPCLTDEEITSMNQGWRMHDKTKPWPYSWTGLMLFGGN